MVSEVMSESNRLIISNILQDDACRNVEFDWDGGTPNYDLKILLPGGIFVEFSEVQGNYAIWLAGLADDTLVIVEITDSTGEVAAARFTAEAVRSGGTCTTNYSEILYGTGRSLTGTGSITTIFSTSSTDAASVIFTHAPDIPIFTSSGQSAGSLTTMGAPASSPVAQPVLTVKTPTPSPSPTGSAIPDTGEKQGGLGTGAIMGVAIGAALVVNIIIAVLITFLLHVRKKRRNLRRTVEPYTSGPSMLDDSDSESSPRDFMPKFSPFQRSRRIQERSMSHAFVPSDDSPVLSTVYRDASATRAPSTDVAESPGDLNTIGIAGDLLSSVSHEATFGGPGDLQSPLPSSPPITQTQDAPVRRKIRPRRLPTSIPPAAIPGSFEPRAAGEGVLLQDTLGAAAGGIGMTANGGRRTAMTRSLRYEMDGGVRLAGGRLDGDERENSNGHDEHDGMSGSGQTVSTLPPPYFRH